MGRVPRAWATRSVSCQSGSASSRARARPGVLGLHFYEEGADHRVDRGDGGNDEDHGELDGEKAGDKAGVEHAAENQHDDGDHDGEGDVVVDAGDVDDGAVDRAEALLGGRNGRARIGAVDLAERGAGEAVAEQAERDEA